MKTFRILAATAALATTATALPASAAQIVLTSSMLKSSPGTVSSSAPKLWDQQTGPVNGASAWTANQGGYLILDLGKAYDFSYFEAFSKTANVLSITAGTAIRYDGFNFYLSEGITSLATATLTADLGDARGNLGGQLFTPGSRNSFRYLQVGLVGSGAHSLNELRLFDGDTPIPGAAVPEPATWALMIGGFGLAGATLRRRRNALA